MAPYFSVITPVYNGSNFVHSYVRSLISQTFQDWEAIVVDDFSTDNTIQVLSSLINGDPRFKVVQTSADISSSSRKGPYKPRNTGLHVATGRFICFLDIDDFWLKNKLSDQFLLLSSCPSLKLLYGCYYKADSTLRRGYLKPQIGFMSIKFQLNFWNPIPNLTSCVDSSLAKAHEFRPVGHEDYLYWNGLVSMLTESQIASTLSPQSIYRSSPLSVSGNKTTVLRWWMSCYYFIGHSLLISLVFIGLKLFAELIEFFLVRSGIIKTIDLSHLRGISDSGVFQEDQRLLRRG
jgi:glycosyltransferase involved in cell wall biosynthesis